MKTVKLGRRGFIGGAGSGLMAVAVGARAQIADSTALAAIEARIGGRLGVAALNTADGARLTRRGDERFAMCSSFKWILAAAVLDQADKGKIALDRAIAFSKDDLLSHSPVTEAHLKEGALPVEALCAAAVMVSDNTAANVLLRLIGGPAGLTGFVRGSGDPTTRLDRYEPALNANLPGDDRDTTTPGAMVAAMNRLLLGDALSATARQKLIGWMESCQTGRDRLRAGLPSDWRVGDKTGTGDNGAVIDDAIAWPPGRAPILIACYLSDSTAPIETLILAQAEVARVVARAFG